jgi:hypothetical protein
VQPTKPGVNINQAWRAVPQAAPQARREDIVASKTHLAGDQVIALAIALAWLVVVSVFGWIDWEMP